MLPKAHLTSHFRMSGSRWVITPLWLSGSWRCFLYSSSVYSWYFSQKYWFQPVLHPAQCFSWCTLHRRVHLFLISSPSVRSIPFLSLIEPIFAWNIPLVYLIFLKKSHVFPILLFSSISLHWSLRRGSWSWWFDYCSPNRHSPSQLWITTTTTDTEHGDVTYFNQSHVGNVMQAETCCVLTWLRLVFCHEKNMPYLAAGPKKMRDTWRRTGCYLQVVTKPTQTQTTSPESQSTCKNISEK